MEPLEKVVAKYFPTEHITRSIYGRFDEYSGPKTNKLSFLLPATFSLYPITVIETDKRVYFDTREMYLEKGSILASPTTPYLVAIVVGLLFFLAEPANLLGVILVSLLAFMLFSIWIRCVKSIVNIMVVDKRWITETSKDERKYTMKGVKLQGSSYYLPHFLKPNLFQKISLVDRLVYLAYYYKFWSNAFMSENFSFNILRISKT